MTNHTPDLLKIPKSLQSLAWRPMKPYLNWHDCDRVLVAVPISNDPHKPIAGWYYEISVVTIARDEHSFHVSLGGEHWEWDLEDADWYVAL